MLMISVLTRTIRSPYAVVTFAPRRSRRRIDWYIENVSRPHNHPRKRVSVRTSDIALPSERRFAGRFAVYEGKGKCEGTEREHGRREGSDITPIGLSEGGDGFFCVGGRVIMTAHCLRYDRYRVARVAE